MAFGQGNQSAAATTKKELETLRGKSWNYGKLALAEGDANPLADVRGELLEIRADFTPAADSEVVFDVRGVRVKRYRGNLPGDTLFQGPAAWPMRRDE